jgi:hypothetical protein
VIEISTNIAAYNRAVAGIDEHYATVRGQLDASYARGALNTHEYGQSRAELAQWAHEQLTTAHRDYLAAEGVLIL